MTEPNPTPLFADAIGPWHDHFAWLPVRTYDQRLVWLRWCRMSYLDWKVGDKVVCVDDELSPGLERILERGRIYTITGFNCATGIFKGETVVDAVLIALAEARSICRDGTPHDLGFSVRRFRPVQPRKTDISLFTAMLNPKKQVVDA